MRDLGQAAVVVAILLIATRALAQEADWVQMKDIKEGALVRVEFHGNRVGILYRTGEMMSSLKDRYRLEEKPVSQDQVHPVYRSFNPHYFVFIDEAPVSGCRLGYLKSGLEDVCTGQRFDFSGRSDEGPDLEIPIHKYDSPTKILFPRSHANE